MLGITQGFTEFAPVSSSGHLILVPWLFHWSILNNEVLNKTFDVALHVGTFVGALGYFWKDIVRYIKAWFHSIGARKVTTTDERLAWYLIIGSIPGAVAGALFESTIEHKLGQPWLIAVMLAVFGVVLYVVDKRSRQTKDLGDLTMGNALFVGVAQAAALQPGVSRSGITITAARSIGMKREAAARFSFLLAMPIIAGAGLFKGIQLFTGSGGGIPPGFGWAFFWGMLSAAVSGYLVIAFLLRYLRRGSFAPFVVYRLCLAALIFALILTGARPATIN